MVSKRVAVFGDRTTTGGRITTGDSRLTSGGIPAALLGCTAYCPKCNSVGTIVEGAGNWTVYGTPVAYDGCLVACGCTQGTNRLIATRSLMFTNVTSVVTLPVRRTSPVKPVTSFNSGARSAPLQNNLTETTSRKSRVPAQPAKVFAKSCTVGDGCSDAAKEQEPSTNFGTMLIYGIASAFTSPAKAQHPSMLPYSGNSENSTYPVNGGVIGGTPVPVVVPTPAGPMVAFAPTPIVRYPSPNINIPTLLDNPNAAFFVSSALLDSANSGKSFTSALMGVLIAELFGDEVQYDEEELRDLAKIQGYAKTRVCFFFGQDEHGQLVAHGLHAVEGSRYENVRVREMIWNSDYQRYEFTQIGQPEPTIFWTPARPEGSDIPQNTGYPAPDNDEFNQPIIHITPIHEMEKGANIDGIPLLDPKDFNDYILVFPADSGIPPLYIYFSKRHDSGIVIGQGETIFGIWLKDAGTDLGSPVPAQVADKLRGKEFASFDQFRTAFWIEVSKDVELSSQFITSNCKRMANGRAPRARYNDTVGGRRSFELHHKHEIQHGGNVYDVDNLSVVTPKRHINIHKGN